jgi:hypothetical protein
LIAYHVPSPSSVIKATIIVALFKLLLSPHSPPTAYVAVFFQGLLGQVLLSSRRYFNIGAILLAVLGLVESAIQRILVYVIVYGNNLWKEVNDFIQKLTHDKTHTNFSLLIAGGYILLHAIIGLFIGIYAARLAKNSAQWKENTSLLLFDRGKISNIDDTQKSSAVSKVKWIFLITWIALIALYIQSYIDPQHSIIPSNIIINILIRSLLIILSWYIILSPLVMLAIRRLLRSQQGRYKEEVKEVMLLLPETKYIFKESFRLSASKKGFSRLKLFLKILLINVLAG